MFGLKGNQPVLEAEAVRVLGDLRTSAAMTVDTFGSTRRVERRLFLTEQMTGFGWAHLHTVVRVESRIYEHGIVTCEDRYFVSSLPISRLTAAQWLRLIRLLWGVECGIVPPISRRPAVMGRENKRRTGSCVAVSSMLAFGCGGRSTVSGLPSCPPATVQSASNTPTCTRRWGGDDAVGAAAWHHGLVMTRPAIMRATNDDLGALPDDEGYRPVSGGVVPRETTTFAHGDQRAVGLPAGAFPGEPHPTAVPHGPASGSEVSATDGP